MKLGDKLTDISPNDKPWESHKSENSIIGGYYADNPEFIKYAHRMAECAQVLVFGQVDISEHEKKLKLTKARFCRVRNCPICAWRRSLAMIARFYKNLPAYLDQYANLRHIHVSLTVKNPPMENLKDTIKWMNDAWKKLLKRKEVLAISRGYIKSIEVTKGQDGNPHPHIHAIIAVDKYYFSNRKYINQKEWRALWKSCLDVDYDPQVNVKRVRPKKGVDVIKVNVAGAELEYQGDIAGLVSGVIEVMKYDTKPADVVNDPDFLYGITEQLFRMRFMETGGCFKDIFKNHKKKKDDDQEVSEDEMMLKNETGEKCDKTRYAFLWKRKEYILGRIFEEQNPPGSGFNRDRGGG